MTLRYDISRLAPDLAELLDEKERDALNRALTEGDDMALNALKRWEVLMQAVGSQLAADIPPADLLVLYALSDDVLDETEAARLAEATDEIEKAVAAHPGLETIVAQIRADRDAFYAIWDEPEKNVRTDRPAVEGARQRSGMRYVWRASAVFAIIVFAIVSVFLFNRDAGFETVRTSSNEFRTIDLEDGSVIRLGQNSTLSYKLDEEDRIARLTGTAVFEVYPDSRSFVVETPSAYATVLGTIFSVTATELNTEVILAGGSVELASRTNPEANVQLVPGQRSRVVSGGAPEAPSQVDTASEMAWSGTWHFQATPLIRIAELISAHYSVNVSVPESLAGERVTGAFSQNEPVEITLQTLATALGIHVETDEDGGFRFAQSDETGL